MNKAIDCFHVVGFEKLCSWIFNELETQNSIFGIPKSVFFQPNSQKDLFRTKVYNKTLETPFGVAAGPHTQLAQNIIVSWLMGGRFIELKTIQTLDELEISKPCIDMLDVGYNCEWSQELKIHKSFEQYLMAYLLIHALNHKLFGNKNVKDPGFMFNMSIGYNLEGIQKKNVQWFLKKMKDADFEDGKMEQFLEIISKFCPEMKEIGKEIPKTISDNVTLSTMHGCPPEEVGKISEYLIEEKKYHTNVKLNPTLLGPIHLRNILNKVLGYKNITVPDLAFGHDLKYNDALNIINNLKEKSVKNNVTFGLKLSNTLEVINNRKWFNEEMMYLSGRPLQGVTVNLARKLMNEFSGDLLVSYAGGADCFNVSDLLGCGMRTITVCSDILRPGGYLRMSQYTENVQKDMEKLNAKNISEFILKKAENEFKLDLNLSNLGIDDLSSQTVRDCGLLNINKYADHVLESEFYQRDTYDRNSTKTNRKLDFFDCFEAPCVDKCPINQKVPDYIRAIQNDDLKKGLEIIREDSSIPTILSRACNHSCELTCTRTQYDQPLAIRELKRYIMDNAPESEEENKKDLKDKKKVKVAIIGAGPCGLSAAYFLKQNQEKDGVEFETTVYEKRAYPFGMVAGTIPGYRATEGTLEKEMNLLNLKEKGVKFLFNHKNIDIAKLKKENDYVVVAIGAQKGLSLNFDNLSEEEQKNTNGILDGLEFLRNVKEISREDNKDEKLKKLVGKNIGIIGGGDVAMDCARISKRLLNLKGENGKVTVFYRRTKDEMPAEKEEVHGLLEEGIEIKELTSPKSAITSFTNLDKKDNKKKLVALRAMKMELGEKDQSGRRKPVEVEFSEYDIPLDTLIVAIGQKPFYDTLFKTVQPKVNNKKYLDVDEKSMETSEKNIFAGGDIINQGPVTIVKACGDGKKIAQSIIEKVGTTQKEIEEKNKNEFDYVKTIKKRSRREMRVEIPTTEIEKRGGFEEVFITLDKEEAKKEANRCLGCDQYCGICESVCPNKAIISYKCDPFEMFIPTFDDKNNVIGKEKMKIKDKYQIAVINNFCNECENCVVFCPTSGKPFKNKPRIFLEESVFKTQDNNAFRIFKDQNEKWNIEAKYNGDLHTVKIDGEKIFYSNPKIDVELDNNAECKMVNKKKNFETENLKECGQMIFLLKNLSKYKKFIFN